jgi:hypothetical protein
MEFYYLSADWSYIFAQVVSYQPIFLKASFISLAYSSGERNQKNSLFLNYFIK